MNILRTDVSVINKFLDNFQELFSRKQFIVFTMFIYAMLKDYKRLNLSALGKEIPVDYQSLQYFFSDSQWSYQDLNNKRINTLRRQRTTGFTKEGVLAIDDTGSIKPFAKKTEGVTYQHCPSLKTQGYCNVAVASCFVKDSKRIPLNFKFYKPQDELPLGKYDEDFRSKLDFAKELVIEALDQDIPFSYVLFDSWYASSDFLEFIDEKKRHFISEIKSDRYLRFRHPVSRNTVWLQEDELVKLIWKHLRHKARIVRYKGALLTIYGFPTRLKNCSVPVMAFVVFNKWSENDSKNTHILISNDMKLSCKKVANMYMQRWGIEQAFRELKDTFYFDHYQVRHKEKIMRYWMLCTLVSSLILWVKLNGCLTKVLNYSPSTCNEVKRALYRLILFTSYSYLSKNAKESEGYFRDIKSQRFKNKFLCN